MLSVIESPTSLSSATFLIGNTVSLPVSSFTPSLQTLYLKSLAKTLNVPLTSTKIVSIRATGQALLQSIGTRVDSTVSYTMMSSPPTVSMVEANLTAPNASFEKIFKQTLINSTTNSTLQSFYASVVVSAPVVALLSSAPSAAPTESAGSASSASVSNSRLSKPGIIAVAVLVPVGFCLLMIAGYFLCCFHRKRSEQNYDHHEEQRFSDSIVARGQEHAV